MAASINSIFINKIFHPARSGCGQKLFIRFSRIGFRRNPVKVFVDGDTSFNDNEKMSEVKEYQKQRKKEHNLKKTGRKLSQGFMQDFSDAKSNTLERFKLPENVRYTRLEEGDHRFGPVIMAAKSKKKRIKENVILLEGKRLIIDAIESGQEIKSIFFDTLEHLKGLPFEDFVSEYYKVTTSHMKLWSDIATPGIMAITSIPEPLQLSQEEKEPITLILDNIRDPGNMGALLRSAAAVGCDKVLLMKGCVDIWEPKVIRSGAGSHFKLCMIQHVGWEEVGSHLPDKTYVTLADNNNQNVDDDGDIQVSQELLEAIAAIEPNTYTEVDEETGNVSHIDETFLDKNILHFFEDVPLPLTSLFETDFDESDHVTVVIGGETAGISVEAKKLTFELNGGKVHVPMMEGVESLNAAIAGSVLLYEIKRQMVKSVQLQKVKCDGNNVVSDGVTSD